MDEVLVAGRRGPRKGSGDTWDSKGDPAEGSAEPKERAELDEKDRRLVRDMTAIDDPQSKTDGLLLADVRERVTREAVRRPGLLRRLLPGLAVAGGIGALEYMRQRFQHSQLYLPDRYPNGIWDPSPYGVLAQDVWFRSQDKTELHGWWIPCKRARGSVLYCHGNSGNITTRIGVFRHLQRLKVNVLAFDYRGYGRSEGEPSEAGVFADARAAYDFLIDELGEAPERILLFGHSLGGAVAIDCALHRRAVGLVAQSTFTNLREMARARFPGMPLHLLASNRFRSLDKVKKLSVPKLFIHGTSDETVPYALGQRLYEHAADPKEWYSVPHAGHNDVYRFGGFRYLWRVSRFAKSCLQAARAQGRSPGR